MFYSLSTAKKKRRFAAHHLWMSSIFRPLGSLCLGKFNSEAFLCYHVLLKFVSTKRGNLFWWNYARKVSDCFLIDSRASSRGWSRKKSFLFSACENMSKDSFDKKNLFRALLADTEIKFSSSTSIHLTWTRRMSGIRVMCIYLPWVMPLR